MSTSLSLASPRPPAARQHHPRGGVRSSSSDATSAFLRCSRNARVTLSSTRRGSQCASPTAKSVCPWQSGAGAGADETREQKRRLPNRPRFLASRGERTVRRATPTSDGGDDRDGGGDEPATSISTTSSSSNELLREQLRSQLNGSPGMRTSSHPAFETLKGGTLP
jgi:hypothetical protein